MLIFYPFFEISYCADVGFSANEFSELSRSQLMTTLETTENSLRAAHMEIARLENLKTFLMNYACSKDGECWKTGINQILKFKNKNNAQNSLEQERLRLIYEILNSRYPERINSILNFDGSQDSKFFLTWSDFFKTQWPHLFVITAGSAIFIKGCLVLYKSF